MDYEVLKSDKMKPDRSTSTSNPTKLLRNAIKEYEYVIEIVNGSRVYICDINFDKLQRKRKKDWERSWKGDKIKFLKSIYKSLGTHTHPNSEYEHEILVSPDMRIVKAMKSVIRSGNKRKTVIENGWKSLVKEFRKKVELDIWDLKDPTKHGNNWDKVKALYELISYAKKNDMKIDTALTALDLKSEEESFSKKLKNSFISKGNKRSYKKYKGALEATKEMNK